MTGDPEQTELRQRHMVLRLYAGLILTKYSAGHLNLDPAHAETRIQRIAKATGKTYNEAADSLAIIHMTAAMLPVLIAQQTLTEGLQSIHGPSGPGSTVQSNNAVFAEFIIEMLLEYDPSRFNPKSETMCEILSRIIGMTALPAKWVMGVINDVYTEAFKRSLTMSESSLITAAQTVETKIAEEAAEKPRIRLATAASS